jgi:hypothetical protein
MVATIGIFMPGKDQCHLRLGGVAPGEGCGLRLRGNQWKIQTNTEDSNGQNIPKRRAIED